MVAGGRLAAALVAAMMLAGCSAIGNFRHVSNQLDSFQYAGNLAEHDADETFTWRNSGSCAVVQWGGQFSDGGFSLRVLDADGTEVHAGEYRDSDRTGALTATRAGAPGDWTVQIAFDHATVFMGLNLFGGNHAIAKLTDTGLAYAGQMCEATSSKGYLVEVPGGEATLSWDGQALAGALSFKVKDGDGNVLGSWKAAPDSTGSFSKPLTGEPGRWALQVSLEDFTGQALLRLDRPAPASPSPAPAAA